ncbi:MAG: hypothetical protein KBT34_01580 [Prevotella sp.]|nr:hypothetical protein [Candidatus Prevotella equi]
MDKLNRITNLIDFEEEHEDDVVFYRKEYCNCGDDSHVEPSYGYFLESEAVEDNEFQEVTTVYTLYIGYDKHSDQYHFDESEDVLTEDEVARLMGDLRERDHTLQFARRTGIGSSLYRLSSTEFYDVLAQINNIEIAQHLINQLYGRL